VADGAVAFLVDEIFHAGISAGIHAPLEGEVVVEELLDGHDVPTSRLAQMAEAAVLNGPTLAGESLLFKSAPTVGGGAVEKQSPAVRFLAIGKGIG